jgi:hypothetical protein
MIANDIVNFSDCDGEKESNPKNASWGYYLKASRIIFWKAE